MASPMVCSSLARPTSSDSFIPVLNTVLDKSKKNAETTPCLFPKRQKIVQDMLAIRGPGGQLFALVPMGGGQRLNQTYGWGTESGSAYGDGGGFDSGVGNNMSDAELYPYNANRPRRQGLYYY